MSKSAGSCIRSSPVTAGAILDNRGALMGAGAKQAVLAPPRRDAAISTEFDGP